MSTARIATTASAAGLVAVMALAEPTIRKWEGYSNDPYRDVAGILTVCVGETAGVQNRRYSDAECGAMLQRSLRAHASPILACLPASTPLSVAVAFVIFGYNVGVANACGSTAAKHVWRGDYARACNGLTAWNKITHPITRKKVVSQGLVNRRADERAICLKGLA